MYYPKSQIKTNLFTNGGEFINEDTQKEYKGYYYKLSTGEFFTGKTPQDKPNSKLIPLVLPIGNNTPNEEYINQDNESVLKYKIFNPNNLSNNIPQFNPVIPTNNEYEIGEFRRYFTKKTNELIYIEIDKDTYELLESKSPKLLWQLYEPFFINWILVGSKEIVYKINKNIVDLIIKNKKLFNFNDYLKNDYIKYWKI